jgi:23S rRNA (cytidine2498-2'-O)-methyltransferase
VAGLLFYCRPGFENDTANEVQAKTSELGIYGYVQAKPNTGYITFTCNQTSDADVLAQSLKLEELIFARQLICFTTFVDGMDVKDRIQPIIDSLDDVPECGDIIVESSDSESGRELVKFCRQFTVPLRNALKKSRHLCGFENEMQPVMHIFFVKTDAAYLGYSYRDNSSPYLQGILRLRSPSDAPSRSTLKLDEAFRVLLSDKQKEQQFSGTHAVDLGACPGGWTYQLVRRGMFVQAVDNGAMAPELMASGQVQHFAEDGFKYKPKKKNVEWLVCDMIEKPHRVAELMAQWFLNKWCHQAIFNLKLPMKQRYHCVLECLEIIDDILREKSMKYQCKVKQLYHDRDEVTVYLWR